MKKLFIGKNDGVAEIVEKVIGAEEKDLILMIPKGAVIGASLSNFTLLKREAVAAQKTIAVESVDENVLALARASDTHAMHPLFEGTRGSSLSDIVPAASEARDRRPINEKDESADALVLKRRKRTKYEPIPDLVGVSRNQPTVQPLPKEKEAEPLHAVQETGERAEVERAPGFLRRRARFLAWGAVAVLLIVGGAWTMTAFMGRATITINFKKTPWTYEHEIVADTKVSKINLLGPILPAERFTADRNLVKLFPASSARTVSVRASGDLTVYNAYSSKSQALVATTRFTTPDGKVFRLQAAVTVPGAQISDGKIIPSSIEASVAADAPGPEYNMGAVSRLAIPGFKGSPKYDGFYGELKSGASGGFVGKKAVATPDDVKNAKERTAEVLRSALKDISFTEIPADYKILDGASIVTISKLTANENTDASGNFSVFGEAQMTAIGFREADLKGLLLAFVAKENPDTVFDTLRLEYKGLQPDFKNGAASFALSAQGTLKSVFSTDEFKTKTLGRSAQEVRGLISVLPGLSDARVSLWPIWLRGVPADPQKVKIVVN